MIRNSGFIANKVKSRYLPIVYNLLDQTKKPLTWKNWRQRQIEYTGIDPLKCKICKKDMILEEVAFWSKKMAGLYVKEVNIQIHTKNFQGCIVSTMPILKTFLHILHNLKNFNTNFLQNLRFCFFANQRLLSKIRIEIPIQK